jgi:DNA-binding NarL/FixJ family response regulator
MSSHQPRHRVALLDDHVLVVDGLARWIEVNAPDFEVVAVAASWEELVQHPSFPPDVVVMARVIDSASTLEERIAISARAGARVVVMSTDAGEPAERDALEAGAHAFVPKSRPAEAVVDAARRVLGSADTMPVPRAVHEVPQRPGLDEWQRRVLRLYATGQSTVDIALIEGVRFERVRRALREIRSSYEAQGRDVSTRDELLRRAAQDGYLTEG